MRRNNSYSAKSFSQNLENLYHHPLHLTLQMWRCQHTHWPFVVFWNNSYVVRLSNDRLCYWTTNLLHHLDQTLLCFDLPPQCKVKHQDAVYFLLSVFARNILENIISSLAFVKGMKSNNSNMWNKLQHSFLVSILRKLTFKLQSFFDNKSLKWFVIIIISLSPNPLISSVGQVCVSNSEAIFLKTGDCLSSSNLDSMLSEIETMALW